MSSFNRRACFPNSTCAHQCQYMRRVEYCRDIGDQAIASCECPLPLRDIASHRQIRARGLSPSKSVTAAGYGHDQVALRSEQFSQRGDVHVQSVFFNDGPGPDRAHQLVFRYEASRRRQQYREHVKRTRTDMDSFPVTSQRARRQIDFECA
ncbi:hypothetical protein BLAT2472_150019 [Burkholderia latens]